MIATTGMWTGERGIGKLINIYEIESVFHKEMTELKTGYYSETMELSFGYAIYTTPEGKEIKVTEVSCGEPLSEHTDLEKVGPVVKCVSVFRHPQMFITKRK
jgi:hypothetical protein